MAIVNSRHYFEILRVAPLRGRTLTAADHTAGLPAVVGLRLFNGNTPHDWMTVVGMIADVLQNTRRVEPDPTIYVPFRLEPRPWTKRDGPNPGATHFPIAGVPP